MKNWRLVVVLGLLLAVAGAILSANAAENGQTVCGNYRLDKAIKVGQATLSAEVASTKPQQEKGLSGRPCIAPDEVMLFVFNIPGYYPFWMKDMKFPIDIIWISSDHRVVTIKKDVLPATYPQSFDSAKPAQYVLELKANRTESLGVQTGTYINF